MIELDGLEYQVKDVSENTADVVAYINDYCAKQGITNTAGETIYIDENPTNPLYMMMFGVGYLTTILQQLIYSAGCGFNIQASSERQLSYLAAIANVKRQDATRTTISGLIYASNYSECKITKDLVASLVMGGTTLEFYPAYETTIPAGSVSPITLICKTAGSYTISQNTITAFDENPRGFLSMKTEASVPGVEQETIKAWRARLQAQGNNSSILERCANAIAALDGVARCSVYFNTNRDDDVEVNGITVKPRHALLIVQGYSDDIAKTYYQYMMTQTTEASTERTTSQNYITHAGQELPVYIVSPELVPLHIKVYINETCSEAQLTSYKQAVMSLAASTYIGNAVSAAEVINTLHATYPELTVLGCYLSQDGTTESYRQTPLADQLFTYYADNITFISAGSE